VSGLRCGSGGIAGGSTRCRAGTDSGRGRTRRHGVEAGLLRARRGASHRRPQRSAAVIRLWRNRDGVRGQIARGRTAGPAAVQRETPGNRGFRGIAVGNLGTACDAAPPRLPIRCPIAL